MCDAEVLGSRVFSAYTCTYFLPVVLGHSLHVEHQNLFTDYSTKIIRHTLSCSFCFFATFPTVYLVHWFAQLIFFNIPFPSCWWVCYINTSAVSRPQLICTTGDIWHPKEDRKQTLWISSSGTVSCTETQIIFLCMYKHKHFKNFAPGQTVSSQQVSPCLLSFPNMFKTSLASPSFQMKTANLLGVAGTDVPIREIEKLVPPYKVFIHFCFPVILPWCFPYNNWHMSTLWFFCYLNLSPAWGQRLLLHGQFKWICSVSSGPEASGES